MSNPNNPLPMDAQEIKRPNRILEQANEAYEALRADPHARREYLDELLEWESTLADGLDNK